MLRHLGVALVLFVATVGCGPSRPLRRGVAVQASPTPGPIVSPGCTTPVSGALRRLPNANAPVLAGATVQWELTLSGGCSTQFRLDGVSATVTSPYLFQKTYSAGANQRETVRATAVYSDGAVNPRTQEIVSEPFSVVVPVTAPLTCEVAFNPPTLTVPADSSGNILGAQPTLVVSARARREGALVPSRVRALTQLTALPVAVMPGVLPVTLDAAQSVVPVSFSKVGPHVFSLEMASGDGAGPNALSCIVNYTVTGVVAVPPPPEVRQFTASLNPVLPNDTTVFSWATSGNPTECQLWGSVRGLSAMLPANGSLQVRNITVREDFSLRCRQVESARITINVVAPPPSISMFLDTPNGRTNPSVPGNVSGLPGNIVFTDLGRPGGADYGQFFYSGAEMEAFVSQQLGIDSSRCIQRPDLKVVGNQVSDSVIFDNTHENGNLMRPTGTVGVYAWGHGGADVQVTLTTNYRTITLRSRYNRWEGNQSPYIFTNGAKLVLGFRSLSGINGYAATMAAFASGEVVTGFRSSNNVFDPAGLPGGLWRVTCN